MILLTNSEMYLGMKYMEIYGILNDRELEKSFKGKISGKPKVEF